MHLKNQSDFLYSIYISVHMNYIKNVNFPFTLLQEFLWSETLSGRNVAVVKFYGTILGQGQARITLWPEVKFENFLEMEVRETIIKKQSS